MFKKLLVAGALLGSIAVASYAEVLTLVPSASRWSYFKGTQEPSAAVGAWRSGDFNVSSWQSANAPFYYGGNVSSGTLLNDMKGSYSTLYLRKSVSLSSGTYENLTLRALCDDGFVLWINRVEVARFNVAEGDPAYSDLSSGTVSTATWQQYDLSAYSYALKAGQDNVLALQAFNCTLGGSSDFAMDIELTAEQTNDLTPPTVLSISPAGGAVIGDPPRVVVNFNEPVTGMSASAILCEGQEASSVEEISSSQYQLKFAERGQDGEISLKWNPNALIYDRSPNKNPFVVPSESWSYTLSTTLPDSDVIINEILASNSKGLETQTGEKADWIELYNGGAVSADIGGWYLTDSANNLTQWQFPPGTTIPAKGYLIVFCNAWTGDPRVNGEYFANFNLSRTGEYLALVREDGTTIAHEFSPSYPLQYSDISYGGGLYYPTPTPGKINGAGYQAPVGEVHFSEPRGYRPAAFELTLETLTEGAKIYYTLDGTLPTTSSTLYTKPLTVNKITYIRAFAVKTGHIDSPVVTRTWLFMDEALSQGTSTPRGWPNSYAINNHRMVYGLNPSVVSKYNESIRTGMTNIETISMVTDLKNLFDPSIGIYVNPSGDGTAWERPASLELISPEGGDEFQIEAGIRIRGGFSRSSANPKHSFRFFFRPEYGGKLEFPLFGREGASEFDKVDLRTSQNYAWSYLAGNPPEYNTFIRETFARDSQRDVGMPYTRSRYYHLFINGQYWGLYQTQERSEADYAETYLGGNDDDWDCIKSGGEASDGNATAFTQLYNISVKEGFAGNYATNYNRIKGLNPDGSRNTKLPVYLDEDNLIQYILNYFYTADPDSPIGLGGNSPNNMYGLYNRVDPSGFKWFRHDAEHSMGAWRNSGVSTSYDMTGRGWDMNSLSGFTPVRLHQKLMDHADYKMHFIDLFQQTYLDRKGAMSASSNLFRWNVRQAEIDKAICAESARWTWDCNMTYSDWLTECNWVRDSFLSLRMGFMLSHLKARGWYPLVQMPVFSQSSGDLSQDTQIYLSGGGTVYYTLDGSDPRSPGGKISSSAQQLEPTFSEERVLISKGSEWDYYDEGSTPERVGTAYWYQPAHPHTGWKMGNARFGFGSKAHNTEVSHVKAGTSDPITTVYFSKRFEVFSSLSIPELVLELNCDDGAVVYLNGSRILDYNMPTSYLTADLFASTDITGGNEDLYTTWQIASKYLVDGENTIAVEVHQSGAASDDLYFDMELRALGGYSGNASEGIVLASPGTIIKARSLSDKGEWSAIATADFTVYSNPEDLKVTEMMYAAKVPEGATAQGWDRDDFAWIELQNTGRGFLNLHGISFVSGIDYTFPTLSLNSGEYVVLAKNLEAFSTQYDTNGMILLEGYIGNLARKGEKLTLQSPLGEELMSFTYSNTWYPSTDQGGYSLVVADPLAEKSLWSSADNWKASATEGGSPGMEDGGVVVPPTVGVITPGVEGALVLNTGESVTLSVEASGSSPLRYQWYRDGVALNGATSADYSIRSAAASHSGVYTVVVINRAGSATSAPMTLSVNFILQLSSISIMGPSSVTEGKTGQYTCSASYNDGTSKTVTPSWSLTPETFATISASGLLTAIAEGEVTLVASYTDGEVSKTVAKPVAIASSVIAPIITTQPQTQTVREGDSVSFSVVATGTEPLSYQWSKNGVSLAGATQASYKIASVVASDAGSYAVSVSNAKGSVTSSVALLKVVTGSGTQLMLDFQFNEGTGSTTVDSISGIVADLGTVGEGAGTLISTDSPSGIAGDHSAVFEGGQWLLGGFDTIPFDFTTPFTWESWIYLDEQDSAYKDFFRLGNILKFGMGREGYFQATFLSVADKNSTVLVPEMTWTHLACEWEPGVGFHFYQDGISVGSSLLADYPMDYQNSLLSLGSDSGGGSLFKGKMDRVRFHEGLLADSQLDADALNPKPAFESTLLSYDFNENNLPFVSMGTHSILLYNGAGEEQSGSPVSWSSSTPSRDQNWPGSENDYSLQLNRSNMGDRTTDRITFPTDALKFDDQSDPSFSVEAWIKDFERRATKQVLLQILGSQSGGVPRIAFAVSNNMTVYLTTMGIEDIDTYAPIPEDGDWHHIACVYDASASLIYVYIDGQLVKERYYEKGVRFTPDTFEVLGCVGSECSGYAPCTGYVDRVRFHKGVLLPADLDYFDYSTQIVAPSLTTQPQSQVVSEGESVTLSVAATGTEPLNYQWYKNGVAINGAVNEFYSIPQVQVSDAGNYTVRVSNGAGAVISSTASLQVNSSTLSFTVAVNDASRVYGSANPVFTYRILNKDGEEVTSTIAGKPVLSTTALLGSSTGTYPIVATRGTLPSEYNYQYEQGTLTIEKATPEITWEEPAAITFGEALSDSQLNASANIAGSFSYDPAVGTVLSAGTHTLSTTFTPVDARNYHSATKTVELIVNEPIVVVLTVAVNDASRVYGSSNPEFTYHILNKDGEDVTSTIAGKPVLSTTALLGSSTGTYPIVATRGTLPSEYNYQYEQGTLTIEKATPEITWEEPTAITFGEPLSDSQLNASANIAGSFSYDPAVGTVLPAGKHTLSTTFTPVDARNYRSVEATVQLIVNEPIVVVLTVAVNDASRVYGSANPEFTYRILNKDGEDVTSTIAGKPVLSTTALLGSSTGTYPIVATRGTLPSEYNYQYEQGTLTIEKATPEITWEEPAAITFGEPLSDSQLNASANIAGSFSYDPAVGTVLPAGTHTLSTTFTPGDARNYNSATKTVELVVNEPQEVVPTLSFVREEGKIILKFTGKLYESDDLITWKLVEGAVESYTLDTNNMKHKYYRSASR